jgi:hypothetical protein
MSRLEVVQHDSFKLGTEDLVAGAFVEYLRGIGTVVASRRPGDPDAGEPDIVCTDGEGRPLGIEITAAYYRPADAKLLGQVVRDLAREGKRQAIMSSSEIGDDDLPPGVFRNPDAKLAANLQAAMEKKVLKRYGLQTFLVLDASWAELTSAADAPRILAQLKRPNALPYLDVFLCLVSRYQTGRKFFRVP